MDTVEVMCIRKDRILPNYDELSSRTYPLFHKSECGVRGDAVGRLRVPFPMVSLEFFVALGLEQTNKNISWG